MATSLSAVCPPETNLTAPQVSHFSLSYHPPICLYFHPSLALLTVPSAPSSCPAVGPALDVLTAPRSHAVAVFCSVMATGATPALSQPMDRQPFFLTLLFSSNFLSPQKFIFARSLNCCSTQSLFLCDLFPSPSPFIADHVVAGKLTERKTGRGRQIRNIQSPPFKGSAQKVCQPSPKRPYPPLHVPPAAPAPRLHACL